MRRSSGLRPTSAGFAAGLARYGEADLFCYRAEGPDRLVERQAAAWDPLLAWARRRFDVDFAITPGINHVPQPAGTAERLGHAVAAMDAFQLAALSPLVTIGGSLVAALAVAEEAFDAGGGVGRGQRRRALADRDLGRRCRSGGDARTGASATGWRRRGS